MTMTMHSSSPVETDEGLVRHVYSLKNMVRWCSSLVGRVVPMSLRDMSKQNPVKPLYCTTTDRDPSPGFEFVDHRVTRTGAASSQPCELVISVPKV